LITFASSSFLLGAPTDNLLASAEGVHTAGSPNDGTLPFFDRMDAIDEGLDRGDDGKRPADSETPKKVVSEPFALLVLLGAASTFSFPLFPGASFGFDRKENVFNLPLTLVCSLLPSDLDTPFVRISSNDLFSLPSGDRDVSPFPLRNVNALTSPLVRCVGTLSPDAVPCPPLFSGCHAEAGRRRSFDEELEGVSCVRKVEAGDLAPTEACCGNKRGCRRKAVTSCTFPLLRCVTS